MALEPDTLVLDGRFRIIRLLGSGDLGEAYLAEQVTLGRTVVLKCFAAELGVKEQMEDRLRAEAARLAAVDHPAVARVLDLVRGEQGLCLVTEHAEGPLLRETLAGEPLLPDRAVEILRQLSEGLAAIHAQGLVHADLRPEKIRLTRTATGEQARLIDFGLAPLVDPSEEAQRVTVFGRALGTPQYFSPEQARGGRPDAASDLYALGVLAYEMISGQLPFAGPEARDFLRQHQEEAPRRVSDVAPHLSDHFRLCELVMRLLEKSPAKRPAAALDVARKLQAIPQVGDPTLLVDAMQVPPVLPERPAQQVLRGEPPSLPEQRTPVAPKNGPLLPSITVPTVGGPPTSVTDAHGVVLVGPLRRKLLPPWAPWAGAAIVAVAAVVTIVAWPRQNATVAEIRTLLAQKQPAHALERIDAAFEDEPAEVHHTLLALKAAAFHQTGQHGGEAELIRALPPGEPAAVQPEVVSGLAEDFGRNEDASLRALLRSLSRQPLLAELDRLARGVSSTTQWGALRYLDEEEMTGGIDLLERYTTALESPDCAVRRTAAQRLARLGDKAALPALVRLKYAPKRDTSEQDCGHREAAAALKRLESPKDADAPTAQPAKAARPSKR